MGTRECRQSIRRLNNMSPSHVCISGVINTDIKQTYIYRSIRDCRLLVIDQVGGWLLEQVIGTSIHQLLMMNLTIYPDV